MHDAARSFPLRGAMLRVLVVTGVLLLVPAVAMQFTDEVAWGPADFIVGAGLLILAGLAMAFGAHAVRGRLARWAFMAAVLLALALVWAELAVGLLD